MVIAGLTLSLVVLSRSGAVRGPGSSAQGLVVQTDHDDDIKLDPKRPLRCFVGGLFVGEMPVSACASRNGVGVGALDVGVDTSGALVGAKASTGEVAPPPPTTAGASELSGAADPMQEAQSAGDEGSGPSTSSGAPTKTCWRYAEAAWTRLPELMSRSACLQTLYDGRCLSPGSASYGRWGDRTLRLTAGRIEVSSDNRVFKTIAQQGPGCSVD